jgi:hypothetical protein
MKWAHVSKYACVTCSSFLQSGTYEHRQDLTISVYDGKSVLFFNDKTLLDAEKPSEAASSLQTLNNQALVNGYSCKLGSIVRRLAN